MQREIKTIIHEFSSISKLEPEERSVALRAEKAAEKAYAPYSQFKVGASVLLKNGEIVDGSNQENAARLSISPATVHNHLVCISRKLGVKGRVQVARWCLRRGASVKAQEN